MLAFSGDLQAISVLFSADLALARWTRQARDDECGANRAHLIEKFSNNKG